MELPRAVSIASEPSLSSISESPSDGNQERSSRDERDGRMSISQLNGRQRHKVQDPARDISIQVLEKFSLVTKFARETTSQLFRENHDNGFNVLERRNSNQSLIDYPQKASHTPEKILYETHVAADPLEVTFPGIHNDNYFMCLNFKIHLIISNAITICFAICQFDKLSLVWGKPRQPPLGNKEVRTCFFLKLSTCTTMIYL